MLERMTEKSALLLLLLFVMGPDKGMERGNPLRQGPLGAPAGGNQLRNSTLPLLAPWALITTLALAPSHR